MSSNQIIEQTTGLDRNPIDKYYTKPTVAQECVTIMKKYALPKKLCDVIVEPSAGNGVFFNVLKPLKCTIRMYDILPEHPQIIKQDYLTLPIDNMLSGKAPNGRIHVMGNPPFGRQASLAIKFIKKTCLFADTISFILPKSFKKDSMRRAFSSNFHLVHQSDLQESSFLVNNKDHDSPCVFQIWIKRDVPRPKPVIYEPIGFSFIKRPDLVKLDKGQEPTIPHIAIRRVGVYAGNIIKTSTIEEAISISDQSHYFIRFHDDVCIEKDIDFIIDLIQVIKYDTDNTVGPRSISKNEMTAAINDKLITLTNSKHGSI